MLYPMYGFTIERAAKHAETLWNTQPICILAYSGGSDQHWQLFHPAFRESPGSMPVFVLTNYTLDLHPDRPIVVKV